MPRLHVRIVVNGDALRGYLAGARDALGDHPTREQQQRVRDGFGRFVRTVCRIESRRA